MKLKSILRNFQPISSLKKYFNKRKPLKLAFAAIFLWSTQAVCMSFGTKQIDFSAILFPAFLTSSIFFFLFKIFYDGKDLIQDFVKPLPRRIQHFVIGSGLIFGSHLFFYLGIQIGPKVETTLTNFLWPLLFILLGYLIFNRSFLESSKGIKIINGIKKFIGNGSLNFVPELMECDWLRRLKIFIGFLGVGLVLTHGQINQINFSHWQGPLLGFIGGFLWAIFSIYLKFLGKVSYMALFIVGTTILSGVLWIHRGSPDLLSMLPIAIYLGLFPLGIAMIAWEKAMKNGHTKEIGMLAFTAPIISTFLLFLFKFDYLNEYFIIGGMMIVFSNINFRDIVNNTKDYLEENENINFTSDLKFKEIQIRIHNVFTKMMEKFSTEGLKIIIYYFLIMFFLFFKKLHIPILK